MEEDKNEGQNTQPKSTCIFCGKTPLTREHFWPSWMKEVFPQSGYNSHLRVEENRDDMTFRSPIDGDQKKVTGPPGSWQLKIVCSTCNNNWMSQIEIAAKPIIIALAFDNSISLSRIEQEILSKWVFLKLIIGEYDSNENRVITTTQRKLFYEHQIIPFPWKIWIAKNPYAIWGYSFNQTLGALEYTNKSTSKSDTYKYKSAMFMIGELTIHIGKFSLQEIDLTNNNQFDYTMVGQHADKVMRTHPSIHGVIEWNKMSRLTNNELYTLHNNIVTFMGFVKSFHQE